MYSDTSAQIRMEKKGLEFEITNGVKQGDPLSPNLFNNIIEEIFWEMEWKNMGIRIDGKWLSNLRFADDVTLFAQDMETLQKMALDLVETSEKAGLKINIKKTVLSQAMEKSNTKSEVVIKGKKIQKVEEVTYLGQIIAFQDRLDKELTRWVSQAWRNFWSLKSVYQTRTPLRLKSKLLETCTYAALTYATQKQLTKIYRTQLVMERSVRGKKLKDRVRNSKIRDLMGTKNLKYVVKKLKLRYAGHIKRYNEDRWEKRVLEWTPYGNKRKKGRPKRRWEEEIIRMGGIAWGRDARIRIRWERMS